MISLLYIFPEYDKNPLFTFCLSFDEFIIYLVDYTIFRTSLTMSQEYHIYADKYLALESVTKTLQKFIWRHFRSFDVQ